MQGLPEKKRPLIRDLDGFVGAPTLGGKLDGETSIALGADYPQFPRTAHYGRHGHPVVRLDRKVTMEVEGLSDSLLDDAGGQ